MPTNLKSHPAVTTVRTRPIGLLVALGILYALSAAAIFTGSPAAADLLAVALP